MDPKSIPGSVITKLTREQAAIIGCFTGVSCGPFSDVHGLIEALLGRPVFTHELAFPGIWEEVKEKSRDLFIGLVPVEDKQ